MTHLAKLTLALSRVHPLVYLLTYLTAIPSFGILYVAIAPQGFYAPYTRYEPNAVSDRAQLASSLELALRRSFDTRPGLSFNVGNWQLEPSTLRVGALSSTDGTHLSFTVSISATGIGDNTGARTLGWSLFATVSETPTMTVFLGPKQVISYHLPDVDFSKFAPSLRQDYEDLFTTVFGQPRQVGVLAPALALNSQEELQFRRFLRGIKGDPSSISGQVPRMIYLSAVVITTLGLGDIIPITPRARLLVATEAVIGIVFAGLFLNALAFRASTRNGVS